MKHPRVYASLMLERWALRRLLLASVHLILLLYAPLRALVLSCLYLFHLWDQTKERSYQAPKLAERVVDVEHDFGGRKQHEYPQKMSILRSFNGEDQFSDDDSDENLWSEP